MCSFAEQFATYKERCRNVRVERIGNLIRETRNGTRLRLHRGRPGEIKPTFSGDCEASSADKEDRGVREIAGRAQHTLAECSGKSLFGTKKETPRPFEPAEIGGQPSPCSKLSACATVRDTTCA
jgi:hypothetical protein